MASKALAFSLLATAASAALDKPVISPEFYPNINQGLLDHLPAPKYTSSQWEAGWIPEDCKTMVEGEDGLSAADVTTYNVTYADCSSPWILCRHKDSDISVDGLLEYWGRIPVGLRSYVRHIVTVPGVNSAYSNGDNILIAGGPNVVTIYGHETGHSLDGHAIVDGGFSVSQTWLDAYNADSAVSDPYGQTSQQENFAQEVNVALFDVNVPGGISTICSNCNEIENQYKAVEKGLGDKLRPGDTCTHRLENSSPVSTSATVSRIMRDMAARAPDVSLRGDVKVLKRREMEDEVEVHLFDERGVITGVQRKMVKKRSGAEKTEKKVLVDRFDERGIFVSAEKRSIKA